MRLQDAKLLMRSLGLPFNAVRYNCVNTHNKNETDKHFFLKALLSYYFLSKGESIFTEYQIRHGIFDIFNLDRMICYEIETEPSSTIYQEKRDLLQGFKDRIEILIVSTKDFSNNLKEAIRQIKVKIN